MHRTLLLLPLAVLMGCAARRSGSPDTVAVPPESALDRESSSSPSEESTVEMEPVGLVATTTAEGKLRIAYQDARTLFERAMEHHQAERIEAAVVDYVELLRSFPRSRQAIPARYNLGMAYDELGRPADALAQYEAVISEAPTSKVARDAEFRAASCLVALDRAREAEGVLGRILARADLSPIDRYVARVRLGDVHLAQGRLDEAEHELRSVLLRGRRRPGDERPLAPRYVLAQAQLGLARVLTARLRVQPLRLPLDQMGRDMAELTRIAKRAQTAFLRTVRLGVPSVVATAGLELGEMHEEVCRVLLEAPVPESVQGEALAVYYEELIKEFRPILEGAVHVYEKSLQTAQRLGVGSAVVAATRRRMEDLRSAMAPGRPLRDLRAYLRTGTVPPVRPDPAGLAP